MGFNPYAAGSKTYGAARSAPNIGPVDKMGYRERDAKIKSKRQAMLKRLKAKQAGNYFSADYLREESNGKA
jgi:hypothetical protein